MTVLFTTEVVSRGTLRSTSLAACTTEAQVNQEISGKMCNEDVGELTEVQLRGLHQYMRACATGLTTTSIETAISAVI